MTTDKEKATALRKIADLFQSIGMDRMAAMERQNADTFDPPRPTYPDGTVAFVTTKNGRRWLSERIDGKWDLGGDGTTNSRLVDEHVTKVEPLRVLADDEIAVPTPHVAHGPLGIPERISDAKYLREGARHIEQGYEVGGSNLTATVLKLLRDAADALDAEAGDAK